MDTKYCKKCDQTLPKSLFTKNSSRHDGLQPSCRECMKIARMTSYKKDKQKQYKRNSITKKRLRQYIVEYKTSNPCTDCGISYEKEPWLMEFDHLDAKEKLGGIFHIINHYQSWARLYAEMDKCELVCVICHRRRTAKRGNWKIDYFAIE